MTNQPSVVGGTTSWVKGILTSIISSTTASPQRKNKQPTDDDDDTVASSSSPSVNDEQPRKSLEPLLLDKEQTAVARLSSPSLISSPSLTGNESQAAAPSHTPTAGNEENFFDAPSGPSPAKKARTNDDDDNDKAPKPVVVEAKDTYRTNSPTEQANKAPVTTTIESQGKQPRASSHPSSAAAKPTESPQRDTSSTNRKRPSSQISASRKQTTVETQSTAKTTRPQGLPQKVKDQRRSTKANIPSQDKAVPKPTSTLNQTQAMPTSHSIPSAKPQEPSRRPGEAVQQPPATATPRYSQNSLPPTTNYPTSTAQPMQVLPMDNIPIPGLNDVLCDACAGKHHPGSADFHQLLKSSIAACGGTPESRWDFCRRTVEAVRARRGRFLRIREEGPNSGTWYDIGDKVAIQMTSFVLYELLKLQEQEGSGSTVSADRVVPPNSHEGRPAMQNSWTNTQAIPRIGPPAYSGQQAPPEVAGFASAFTQSQQMMPTLQHMIQAQQYMQQQQTMAAAQLILMQQHAQHSTLNNNGNQQSTTGTNRSTPATLSDPSPSNRTNTTTTKPSFPLPNHQPAKFLAPMQTAQQIRPPPVPTGTSTFLTPMQTAQQIKPPPVPTGMSTSIAATASANTITTTSVRKAAQSSSTRSSSKTSHSVIDLTDDSTGKNTAPQTTKGSISTQNKSAHDATTSTPPSSQRTNKGYVQVKMPAGSLGVHLAKNLVVTKIRPGSSATGKLFVGDRIVQVDGRHFTEMQSVARYIASTLESKRVLLVMRQKPIISTVNSKFTSEENTKGKSVLARETNNAASGNKNSATNQANGQKPKTDSWSSINASAKDIHKKEAKGAQKITTKSDPKRKRCLPNDSTPGDATNTTAKYRKVSATTPAIKRATKVAAKIPFPVGSETVLPCRVAVRRASGVESLSTSSSKAKNSTFHNNQKAAMNSRTVQAPDSREEASPSPTPLEHFKVSVVAHDGLNGLEFTQQLEVSKIAATSRYRGEVLVGDKLIKINNTTVVKWPLQIVARLFWENSNQEPTLVFARPKTLAESNSDTESIAKFVSTPQGTVTTIKAPIGPLCLSLDERLCIFHLPNGSPLSGKLLKGDRLLRVAGIDVQHMKTSDVVKMFANLPFNQERELQVRRLPNGESATSEGAEKTESVAKIASTPQGAVVTITAPKGPLCLSLDERLCIFHLPKGSPLCGKLLKGDKLLTVSGVDVQHMKTSDVVAMINGSFNQERVLQVRRFPDGESATSKGVDTKTMVSKKHNISSIAQPEEPVVSTQERKGSSGDQNQTENARRSESACANGPQSSSAPPRKVAESGSSHKVNPPEASTEKACSASTPTPQKSGTVVFVVPPGRLGIDLHNDLTVEYVAADGPVSGKIYAGDMLIKINGMDLRYWSWDWVENFVASTSKQERRLEILRKGAFKSASIDPRAKNAGTDTISATATAGASKKSPVTRTPADKKANTPIAANNTPSAQPDAKSTPIQSAKNVETGTVAVANVAKDATRNSTKDASKKLSVEASKTSPGDEKTASNSRPAAATDTPTRRYAPPETNLVTVVCPPGRLGVNINKLLEVVQVFADSCMKDILSVGDKWVMIDDKNVRGWLLDDVVKYLGETAFRKRKVVLERRGRKKTSPLSAASAEGARRLQVEKEAKRKAEEAKRQAEAAKFAEYKAFAEERVKAMEEADRREATLKADAEAKRRAEEVAKLKAAQEAKRRDEAEAKLKAQAARNNALIEAAKVKDMEEAKLRAEEVAKLKADAELKRRAEEVAKLKAAQEAKRRAEAEAKLKAQAARNDALIEAAKIKDMEEAKLRAEEVAKLKATEEAKRRAEDEAKLTAQAARKNALIEAAKNKDLEEAKLRAEEVAKLKAAEEAKRRAEDEAKLKAAEEAKRRAEDEAKLKAQAARNALIEAAKLKDREEAKRPDEEAARVSRLKALEEAGVKAKEDIRLRAENEANLKAEEEAKRRTEEADRNARRKVEEETKRRAEEQVDKSPRPSLSFVDVLASQGLLGVGLNESLVVKQIYPDSPLNGKLFRGDKLVRVDGVSVRKWKLPDAVKLIVTNNSRERLLTFKRKRLATQEPGLVSGEGGGSTATTEGIGRPSTNENGLIEIVAPGGALGICLGPGHRVSRIVQSSPLCPKIRVGDLLVTVDNTNIEEWEPSAVKDYFLVTANRPQRILHFRRQPARIIPPELVDVILGRPS